MRSTFLAQNLSRASFNFIVKASTGLTGKLLCGTSVNWQNKGAALCALLVCEIWGSAHFDNLDLGTDYACIFLGGIQVLSSHDSWSSTGHYCMHPYTLQFYSKCPTLCTGVASMNIDGVCDENLANCEHKHKFLANALFPDTGTMLFWNGTCKSLHLFHIAQLDQLKFQILSEQMRKNLHIRILLSHSCSFHKI